MYLLLAFLFAGVVKVLAMLEWPTLYRAFLFPPAQFLGFFFTAEYEETAGIYTFPGFILDYSCSGIHFFIITILLITFSRVKTAGGFLTALLTAYSMTLAANTARVALFLKVAAFSSGRPWLHEAIGTIVFISFLFFYYLATDVRRKYATEK
jgi:exosortase K